MGSVSIELRLDNVGGLIKDRQTAPIPEDQQYQRMDGSWWATWIN